MNLKRMIWFVIAIPLLGGIVHAKEFDKPFYFKHALSYVFSDDNRESENGGGISLSVGKKFSRWWNMELGGVGDLLEHNNKTKFKQVGILADALYFFNRKRRFAPFVVIGGGVMQTKFDGPRKSSPMANIGVGFLSEIAKSGAKLRGDARLRHDESNLLGESNFQDWVISLGLSFPIGGRSSIFAEEETEQEEMFAQAQTDRHTIGSVIANIQDDDKDGIANQVDQCENTPHDAEVDEQGCFAKDGDSDGIIDLVDNCPNSPTGVKVGRSGCELDSDGDGIADSRDACANTLPGVAIDVKGCIFDVDADGIADNQDQCNETRFGTKVNNEGCELDSDADGIADSGDQCGNTPANFQVDSQGCTVDSDIDGIADNRDQCADTPAWLKVNEVGCELDSDNDGLVDRVDACPKTKLGAVIDREGCDIRSVIAAMKDIRFAANSTRLSQKTKTLLDGIAKRVMLDPNIFIEVAGHSDMVGSLSSNEKLALQRAENVRTYLISRGVPDRNLQSKGYGSTHPLADNATEDGRAKNRRVEFFVME